MKEIYIAGMGVKNVENVENVQCEYERLISSFGERQLLKNAFNLYSKHFLGFSTLLVTG